MFDFCQPMIDVHGEADAVQGKDGVFFRAFAFGKLNAVIGQDGMDLIGNGLDQMFEKRSGDQARGPFVQLGIGERRCAVDDVRSMATNRSSLPSSV